MAGGIERTAGRMNLDINVVETARTAHNSQPWPSRRGPQLNLSRTAIPLTRQPRDYVQTFVPVAAFLIRGAAFLASSSVSKPMTAANFRPTTCAIKNAILIPTAATLSAMA